MRKRIIQLNILTLSILCAQQSFALQELEDSSLSQISGQDGISLQIDADKVEVGEVNWKDSTQTSAGTDDVLNLSMQGIKTTPYNGATGLSAKFTADVGGKPGAPAAASNGLRLNAVLGPATMNIANVAVCSNAAGGRGTDCSNSASLGALTFQNRKDLTFSLETQSGLFNSNSPASLGFGLKNSHIFYTLNNSGTDYNQLILKDFNFNFSGDGYLYLDPTDGVVLSTNKKSDVSSSNSVVLGDVDDPDFSGKKQPGLNVDLRYKKGVGLDYTKYKATGLDSDILSFGRLGASGVLKNAYIKLNATQLNDLGAATSGTANTGTGNLVGKGGLHMQMKTDFVNDPQTYFDLGLSGKNAYAIRFRNLTPLQIRKDTVSNPTSLNSDLAYINFGDIYINAAKTNTVNFPLKAVLNKIYSGTFSDSTLKTALYASPTTTPANAIVIAIRGMDFQAIARQGAFVADNSINNPPSSNIGTWGLGLPIYNLNSNIGLYGIKGSNDRQSLGFGLSMSTEGRNSTGSKTTSIMLIDGAISSKSGEAVNYYAGLRNINLFANLTGTVNLSNSGLWLNVPQLVAALDAEVAIGQLPGSRIVSTACAAGTSDSSCFVPSNNFTTYNDVLFGIAARIDGKANLIVEPNSGTGLAIYGDVTLNAGSTGTVPNNYLRISDKPSSGQYDSPSQLGIDGLSGKFNLTSTIGIDAKTISLNNTVKLNDTNAPTDVLRADVNLYPKVDATGSTMAALPPAQPLGQMVMTGGNIRSNFGITPR